MPKAHKAGVAGCAPRLLFYLVLAVFVRPRRVCYALAPSRFLGERHVCGDL